MQIIGIEPGHHDGRRGGCRGRHRCDRLRGGRRRLGRHNKAARGSRIGHGQHRLRLNDRLLAYRRFVRRRRKGFGLDDRLLEHGQEADADAGGQGDQVIPDRNHEQGVDQANMEQADHEQVRHPLAARTGALAGVERRQPGQAGPVCLPHLKIHLSTPMWKSADFKKRGRTCRCGKLPHPWRL